MGGLKMLKEKYFIGQKFKNSPTDNFPYFRLTSITESPTGLKFYRLQCLYDDEIELVLHEEDLYPMTKKDIVENELKNLIIKHDTGQCNCDLTDGGYGLCYAGQYVEGVLSVDDVISNMAIKEGLK
jgi:hypothetical protein